MCQSLLEGADPAPREFDERHALSCLLGALGWALPRALGFWGGPGGEVGMSSPGVGVVGYLALVGCGLLSLVIVSLSWGARGAFHSPARRAVDAVILGLGLALTPCVAFAYWLAVATHHRPLGAVTYAAGALCMAVLSTLVARWLVQRRAVARESGWGSELLLRVAWGFAALGVCTVAIAAAYGVFQHVAFRAVLPDLALGLVVASVVCAIPGSQRQRRGVRWAVPMCVGVWVVTLGLLASSSAVRATVKSTPIIAGVAGLALR